MCVNILWFVASARHLYKAAEELGQAAQLYVFILGTWYLYLWVLKHVFGYGFCGIYAYSSVSTRPNKSAYQCRSFAASPFELQLGGCPVLFRMTTTRTQCDSALQLCQQSWSVCSRLAFLLLSVYILFLWCPRVGAQTKWCTFHCGVLQGAGSQPVVSVCVNMFWRVSISKTLI